MAHQPRMNKKLLTLRCGTVKIIYDEETRDYIRSGCKSWLWY